MSVKRTSTMQSPIASKIRRTEEKKVTPYCTVRTSTPTEAKVLISDDVWTQVSTRFAKEMVVEACGGNPDMVFLKNGNPNGLLATFHMAYADHFPLALTPDDIWITIAQGFARHVAENAEAMRSVFTSHSEEKKVIEIEVPFVKGRRDNPWDQTFDQFKYHIAKLTKGGIADLMEANFSTTTPVSSAVSNIVLMESMKDDFDYRVWTRCGIPEFHIYGSPNDWRKLRAKAQELQQYGLEWWIPHLDKVLANFEGIVSGENPDQAFWEEAYKRTEMSGGDQITGWINVLFPYMSDGRNKYVEWSPAAPKGYFSQGNRSSDFPSGVSGVPIRWNYMGTIYQMKALGGHFGVGQRPDTKALAPYMTWAVAEMK